MRPANSGDIPSLVELRLVNANAHLTLDPDTYRIPEPEAIARHFAAMLADSTGQDAVFVAVTPDGRVLGMVEVLRRPDPPDHQILPPEPSAQVHTVVLSDARGNGIGSALLKAANRWARDHGIRYISAGIHHRNAAAVHFYSRNGYTNAGLELGRQVTD